MAKKISGRIKRAISSSLILFAVAGVLAASNIYSQNRDRQATLGPQSESQKQFFLDAVNRPDISAFFKRFKSAEKVQAAKNLARYRDPRIVKLATTWLTDFDPEARKQLEAALISLAPVYPQEVAAQLDKSGGFQKLGVANALRAAFTESLPFVIDQLSVAAARSNAVEYLAASGERAGAAIVPKLSDRDKDTRLAAADAIGKIGYQQAGPQLRQLYAQAEPADRSTYLAALANLGDPASETAFREVLTNQNAASGDLASAILGLGRIATKSAIQLLANELKKRPLNKTQIVEALSLAGDASLSTDLSQDAKLEVAAGIQSQRADAIIATALSTPNLSARATEVAIQRPSLVPPLLTLLAKLNPTTDGKSIESTINALASTPQGRTALKNPALKATFGGFIRRQITF